MPGHANSCMRGAQRRDAGLRTRRIPACSMRGKGTALHAIRGHTAGRFWWHFSLNRSRPCGVRGSRLLPPHRKRPACGGPGSEIATCGSRLGETREREMRKARAPVSRCGAAASEPRDTATESTRASGICRGPAVDAYWASEKLTETETTASPSPGANFH